jgi:hypothetical protein
MKMTEKRKRRTGAQIQALKAVLITLLAIYGTITAGSILFAFKVFPSVIKMPSGTSFWSIAEMVRVLFDRVVPGLVYVFIGWSIFKLIALNSRREPFSPAAPRHIRRIGYGVLVLAAAGTVVDVIKGFRWPVDILSRTFISAACGILSSLLLGLGFLVIARVIESGVRLQQDQDLTV